MYPPPDLYSCLTGFSNDAVSNWITNAMMAGYLKVDDPSDTFGRLAAGDGDALRDIHWNMDGSGNEMYEKLWSDKEYDTKSLWCGNEENFLAYVRDEESSYQKDVGNFKPWVNPNQCSNMKWDEWMTGSSRAGSPEEIEVKPENHDDKSAANSFVTGTVGLVLILKQLLGM